MQRKAILAVIVFCCLFPQAIAETKTILTPTPPTVTTQKNKLFIVNISVLPGEIFDTVAIDTITWDKNILECTNLERGDLFDDHTIWIPGTISEGKIRLMCWGSREPTEKQGTFVSLTFRALTDGKTNISFDDIGIASEGEPRLFQSKDCAVTVGTGIYEPTEEEGKQQKPFPFMLVIGIAIVFLAIIVVARMHFKKET